MAYSYSTKSKAMLLHSRGHSQNQIAKIMGIHLSNINRWCNSEEYKKRFGPKELGIDEAMEELALIGIEHIRSMMLDPNGNEKDQLRAALKAIDTYTKVMTAGINKQVAEATIAALNPDELKEKRDKLFDIMAKAQAKQDLTKSKKSL